MKGYINETFTSKYNTINYKLYKLRVKYYYIQLKIIGADELVII